MRDKSAPVVDGLRVARAIVDGFLGNVPYSVYFKDRRSRFIANSQSQAAQFGVKDVKEVQGKTDFDFFTEFHARQAFDDEQQIIRTGKPVIGKLEKEVWPDGRVTWALSTKLPLREASGAIIGTFGLSRDVTKSVEAKAALESARKDLMDASRVAGMAEVASDVLHRVGNLLSSLHVSASMITTRLRHLKADSLAKLSALLVEHKDDVAGFLTNDPRGRRVVEFLDSLDRHYREDHAHLLGEISMLQKDIDHIKEIVAMQQAYAATSGVVEPFDPVKVMEDSIRMNLGARDASNVTIVREFQAVPEIMAERRRVLQILTHLILNAKQALEVRGAGEKELRTKIENAAEGRVRFIVQDNGCGISSENLARVFQHAFTTKPHGGGFGLHSAVLAAKEMGGTLVANSDGPGTGATFTLELPASVAPAPASPTASPREAPVPEPPIAESTRSEPFQLPGPEEHEQELLLKRTLVNAFLENIPDYIYFKDLQCRFIAASKSLALRHGCANPAELVGKTDADFFQPNYAELTRQEEDRIMRTGKPMLDAVRKVVWSDGQASWVRTCKLPLRDESGEIIGTFGITEDITAARQMEDDLERTRKEFIESSRLAGMAEVATGLLHNIGNVLNSLNVSASMIETGIKQSKSASLGKLAALLKEHSAELTAFITGDPKGKRVPEFLAALAVQLAAEQAQLVKEVESLQKYIDHIKDIVTMQQNYATMGGFLDRLSPVQLMEDSLRMNSGALIRHEIAVVREFEDAPEVMAERGKVLQILINLIRNAKYALDSCKKDDKVMRLRVECTQKGTVRFVVQDNGVGIPAENMSHIFQHGFTTKINGHGFGLHSSVLAAKEMEGTLTAESNGAGHGATFILELPLAGSRSAGERPAA
jgi:PAS domain S-box-containing protein